MGTCTTRLFPYRAHLFAEGTLSCHENLKSDVLFWYNSTTSSSEKLPNSTFCDTMKNSKLYRAAGLEKNDSQVSCRDPDQLPWFFFSLSKHKLCYKLNMIGIWLQEWTYTTLDECLEFMFHTCTPKHVAHSKGLSR